MRQNDPIYDLRVNTDDYPRMVWRCLCVSSLFLSTCEHVLMVQLLLVGSSCCKMSANLIQHCSVMAVTCSVNSFWGSNVRSSTRNETTEKLRSSPQTTNGAKNVKQKDGERYGPRHWMIKAGCSSLMVVISGSTAPPPQTSCWTHSESRTWRQMITNGLWRNINVSATYTVSVRVSRLTGKMENKIAPNDKQCVCSCFGFLLH